MIKRGYNSNKNWDWALGVFFFIVFILFCLFFGLLGKAEATERVTLFPNGDVGTPEWDDTSGWVETYPSADTINQWDEVNCVDGNHYNCVNTWDPTGVTYLTTGIDNEKEWFKIDDFSVANGGFMPSGSVIDGLDLFFINKRDGLDADVRGGIRIAGTGITWSDWATHTVWAGDSVIDIDRPGTDDGWNPTALDSAQIGVDSDVGLASNSYCATIMLRTKWHPSTIYEAVKDSVDGGNGDTSYVSHNTSGEEFVLDFETVDITDKKVDSMEIRYDVKCSGSGIGDKCPLPILRMGSSTYYSDMCGPGCDDIYSSPEGCTFGQYNPHTSSEGDSVEWTQGDIDSLKAGIVCKDSDNRVRVTAVNVVLWLSDIGEEVSNRRRRAILTGDI